MNQHMFIEMLQNDPKMYFTIVVCVIVSIVLHELSHGWAAIRLGDNTPLRTGHMTGNPVTHMGWMSLAALFLCGIAWGRMPVDPTRFRHKYGDAIVAAAGPAMNLLLAFLALTGVGLWFRADMHSLGSGLEPSQMAENAHQMLLIFGSMNFVLFLFNLVPIPPLDGASILATFNSGYRTFIRERASPQLLMGAFAFLFFFAGRYLVDWGYEVSMKYVMWLIRL